MHHRYPFADAGARRGLLRASPSGSYAQPRGITTACSARISTPSWVWWMAAREAAPVARYRPRRCGSVATGNAWECPSVRNEPAHDGAVTCPTPLQACACRGLISLAFWPDGGRMGCVPRWHGIAGYKNVVNIPVNVQKPVLLKLRLPEFPRVMRNVLRKVVGALLHALPTKRSFSRLGCASTGPRPPNAPIFLELRRLLTRIDDPGRRLAELILRDHCATPRLTPPRVPVGADV